MASRLLIIAQPYEAELIRQAAEEAGYEPRLSQGNDDLAARVAGHRLDAAVVSLRLRRADPRAVLAAIRSGAGGRHLPVVVIADGAADAPPPHDLTGDAVVGRPLDTAALVARVGQLLEDATLPAPGRQAATSSHEEAAQRLRLEAKVAQVMEADYFTLLELDPSADGEQVQQAYQRLSERFEPRRLAPDLARQYGEQLATIQRVLHEAYVVLRDEQRRQAYREHLE